MATCHFSCHFPVPLALRSSDLTVISAAENDGVVALRTTLENIRKMGGFKKVRIVRTEMEAKIEKLSIVSLHRILGNCSFKSDTHTKTSALLEDDFIDYHCVAICYTSSQGLCVCKRECIYFDGMTFYLIFYSNCVLNESGFTLVGLAFKRFFV